MSQTSKKRTKRKRSPQYLDNIKPPSPDNLEKEPQLFLQGNQDIQPSYLQMPIKIQGDLRSFKTQNRQSRLNEESIESSEVVANDNNSLYEESPFKNPLNQLQKQPLKDDYEDLINPQNKIDVADLLLMPYFDQQHQISLKNLEVKQEEEEESHPYQTFTAPKEEEFSQVQLESQTNDFEQLLEEKKSLLTVINSFKAVMQATSVAINYHKLAKKDSLNKVYSSVFNVLAKESRKLEEQLKQEEMKLDTKIEEQMQKEEIEQRRSYSLLMNKELGGTTAGYEQVKMETPENKRSK